MDHPFFCSFHFHLILPLRLLHHLCRDLFFRLLRNSPLVSAHIPSPHDMNPRWSWPEFTKTQSSVQEGFRVSPGKLVMVQIVMQTGHVTRWSSFSNRQSIDQSINLSIYLSMDLPSCIATSAPDSCIYLHKIHGSLCSFSVPDDHRSFWTWQLADTEKIDDWSRRKKKAFKFRGIDRFQSWAPILYISIYIYIYLSLRQPSWSSCIYLCYAFSTALRNPSVWICSLQALE
jgi:hypothetical protein